MIQENINVIPGVMLFAVIQGMILMVLLLKLRTGNRLGHRILALLILFFTLHLIYDLLVRFGYFKTVNEHLSLFDFILMVICLTLSPLVYLYTDVITRKKPSVLNRSFWSHFLPSAIFLISVSLFFILNLTTPYMTLLYAVAIAFFLIQIATYLILSFIKLKRHKKNINALFSNTERINLNWLRNILLGFSTFYLLVWFGLFSEVFEITKQADDIITLAMVGLVYLFGYMGMQQADIFSKELQAQAFIPKSTEKVLNESNLNVPVETINIKTRSIKPKNIETNINIETKRTEKQKPEKYQTSSLDKETSKLLFDDLVVYMTEKKPYLENNISLSGLAKQMNLLPNYLSQVINEQSQSNFFDFINRYRVNHVKSLIAEQVKSNQKVNMMDNALASGFNSKSAFYNAFKKYESMTPSQYRQSIR